MNKPLQKVANLSGPEGLDRWPPFCTGFYMERIQLKLEAPWSEVKEQIKEHNVWLTDEDLHYEPGNEEELIARLERKLGKSRTEIIALIESISANRGMAG